MLSVPDQLRKDNWTLFVMARGSYEASIKVPATRELIGSLRNTMTIADITEYDTDLLECDDAAIQALRKYPDDPREALIICGNIIAKIGHILYKKEFATPQGDSFKFPIKETA